MTTFTTCCEVRWADLDPNGHARHTAYLDWATHNRMTAFATCGLSLARFNAIGIGPMLFREEADYLREVQEDDQVSVSFEVIGASVDWKHWRIRHRLARRDGVPCAVVVARGAWFDLRAGKVSPPPPEFAQACELLPRASDFEVLVSGRRPHAE